MLVLLSPSKTQDFETKPGMRAYTQPAFLAESKQLIAELRKLKVDSIRSLMEVSQKIAELNYQRYRHFSTPFTSTNAKQAIFAFQGDVYDGFDAATLDAKSLSFAQSHLRILSGLYGVLKPFDLIQPYRLEMKIRLKNPHGKDLYQFWGDRLTQLLKDELKLMANKTVINLASEEYFHAIQPEKLGGTLISPQFKEKKAAVYKIIALYAKQARGMMARYIASHQIDEPEALRFFNEDGYKYNAKLSTPAKPVFTRG